MAHVIKLYTPYTKAVFDEGKLVFSRLVGYHQMLHDFSGGRLWFGLLGRDFES